MTTPTPAPAPAPRRVHPKVTASTSAAALAGVAVAVLDQVVGNNQLLGALPPYAQVLIAIIVPALVTFLAGYAKRA